MKGSQVTPYRDKTYLVNYIKNSNYFVRAKVLAVEEDYVVLKREGFSKPIIRKINEIDFKVDQPTFDNQVNNIAHIITSFGTPKEAAEILVAAGIVKFRSNSEPF